MGFRTQIPGWFSIGFSWPCMVDTTPNLRVKRMGVREKKGDETSTGNKKRLEFEKTFAQI